ncbi:MAG TPA: ROK family protein [Phycisphaerales bacterium]|nr:ROK family protein [Phycisphaerales bacterium]
MAMERPVVGIDLGGTNMQVGVVRPDAREVGAGAAILGTARKKTKAEEGFEVVLDRVVAAVGEACEAAGMKPGDLGGVGIGAPGAVDPATGIVFEAVNLRWKEVELAKVLGEKLGLPVAVDNDVNVAVYGEWVLGAARGATNVLGVWVGTGIGGGLILNGRMFYGHYHTAGEIGHMLIFPNNPPGTRSLEHNCSRTAVVERIVRLIQSNRKSMLSEISGEKYEKIKSRALAQAYAAGDELTREVVDDAARLIGNQIGGIVTLLSLERVVLGGGLTEAIGEPFVARVREATKDIAFPDVCKGVDVVASELLDNAGLLGAAMIAADRVGE